MKAWRVLVIVWITLTGPGCTGSLHLSGRHQIQDTLPECRLYIRSQRAEIPPLPDLNRIGNVSSERLNIIQAEYVKELRTFVAVERSREDEEYHAYLRRCLR